jgi:DNA invertase Pin-like site-specific DNA recombinase
MQQGQRIGYVRVSSFDQNPDRASGKDVERPELQALLEYAKANDTVVVHSMNRLARRAWCSPWRIRLWLTRCCR